MLVFGWCVCRCCRDKICGVISSNCALWNLTKKKWQTINHPHFIYPHIYCSFLRFYQLRKGAQNHDDEFRNGSESRTTPTTTTPRIFLFSPLLLLRIAQTTTTTTTTTTSKKFRSFSWFWWWWSTTKRRRGAKHGTEKYSQSTFIFSSLSEKKNEQGKRERRSETHVRRLRNFFEFKLFKNEFEFVNNNDYNERKEFFFQK